MKMIISLLLASALFSAASRAADLLVHPGVSISTIDRTALKDILTGKTSYWESGQAITIVLAQDKADGIIQEITGMSASQFKTHWQRLTFSGRGKQPKVVDPDKLISTIFETKGSMAFSLDVPGSEAGVKKIEIK